MDIYRMDKNNISMVRRRLDSAIDDKFPLDGQTRLSEGLLSMGNKVSQQNISKFIKGGKRLPGWLSDAADVLGVTMEWLKTGDSQKQATKAPETGLNDSIEALLRLYDRSSHQVQADFHKLRHEPKCDGHSDKTKNGKAA